MSRDSYWSVDKLLPRVGVARPSGTGGVPIGSLSPENGERNVFGEKIFVPESRVIRHFSLSLTDSAFSFPQIPIQDREVSFVPCDLFSPTYLSLSDGQRRYFHYFTYQTDRKIKAEATFAYLKLALCRILAQCKGDDLPETFFFLWESYRRDFPAAEKLFCDVWCDWCFLHKKAPDPSPFSALICGGRSLMAPFLYQIFLFDCLCKDGKEMNREEAEFLLNNVSSLSFRKSRAYKSHHRYAELVELALSEVMRKGVFNHKATNDSLFQLQIPAEVRTMRVLFPDLPRIYTPNVKICLVYVPLLYDEVVRDRCDAVVRYVDNSIRSILKMKNHLGQVAVTPAHRFFLDPILAPYRAFSPPDTPQKSPVREEAPDPPRELHFDPEKAREIEEDSWDVTEKLTKIYEQSGERVTLGQGADEVFDQTYKADLERIKPAVSPDERSGAFWEFAAALTPQEDQFLSVSVHLGADAARQFAKAGGLFFDALVSSCNVKATEETGDAVFDPSGKIFPEYREELMEVFLPPKGESDHA